MMIVNYSLKLYLLVICTTCVINAKTKKSVAYHAQCFNAT